MIDLFKEIDRALKQKYHDGATQQEIANKAGVSQVHICNLLAGVPRHAVRGLVGHISDSQTDLYSHDLTSARLVQSLPRVKLD